MILRNQPSGVSKLACSKTLTESAAYSSLVPSGKKLLCNEVRFLALWIGSLNLIQHDEVEYGYHQVQPQGC